MENQTHRNFAQLLCISTEKLLHIRALVLPSYADHGSRTPLYSVWNRALHILHVGARAFRRTADADQRLRAEVVVAWDYRDSGDQMTGDHRNSEVYRTAVCLSSVIRGARRPLLLLLLLVARMTSKHLVEEIKLRRNTPCLKQS